MLSAREVWIVVNFKITNERLLVDELNLQLQYDKPITSTGSTMTLPAPSADLTDWISAAPLLPRWGLALAPPGISTYAHRPKPVRSGRRFTEELVTVPGGVA